MDNNIELYERLINDVQQQGYSIVKNFFSKPNIDELRRILMEKLSSNSFKTAGIGKQELFTQNNRVRSDEISWIDNERTELEAEKTVVNELNQFMNYLNSTCYTGLKSFEFHYAHYKEGSFYKRHLDQFKNDDQRKYTLIIYLNEDWQAENGGQLVMYLNNGTLEVLPEAGTVVFFESSSIEHEVLVCHRERLSITGWFKTK
jgi:SM-20-related protein